MNWSLLPAEEVPVGLVTRTWTVPPAWGGAMAVICVELLMMKDEAGTSSNFTAVASVKLVPVIVTLVPLFMAQGSHLRNDLPALVQRAAAGNPGLSIRIAPAIGDVDALLDAIAQWVLEEDTKTRAADLDPPVA